MRDSISPAPAKPEPPAPIPWVTWSLAASTVAVFLVQLYFYHLRGDDVVGEQLAFSSGAMAEHRYYTILTYAWAHAVSLFGYPWLFFLHIGFNVMALLWFGPAVEELIGPLRFLGLYLGGAIMAALTWYLFAGAVETNDGIIGSSGAAFAVLGALGTLAPTDWVLFPFSYPLGRRIRWAILVMCAFEAVPPLFHWMPEVAHSAHLGGAVFGCLYILAIRRRVPVEDRP